MTRLLCAALSLFSCATGIARDLPSIETFFAPAAFTNPKLSANGRQLAVVGSQDRNEYLALIDLATMQPRPIGTLKDAHLRNYWWKGDHTLLCLVESQNYIWRFRSIDTRTGATREHNQAFFKWGFGYAIVHPLPDDPDQLLVVNDVQPGPWQLQPRKLSKLSLRTGRITPVVSAPGSITRWFTDRRGEAVAVQGISGDRSFLKTRDAAGRWVEADLGLTRELKLEFVGVHPDGKRLLATDRNGGDTRALLALDPRSLEREEVFRSPAVDVDDLLTWGDNDPAPCGVSFETDRVQAAYFDPEARAIAASVGAALPDTTNTIVSASGDHRVLVIMASHDRLPGMYYLLDRNQGRLSPLGAVRPDLPPDQLARSEPFQFTARDGLVISGRLYLPAGRAVRPPLLVHVGPSIRESRARNGYAAMFQLLASRGYAVARINHRGTSGFGLAFARAGDRAFGTAMPADLEDGAQWLVRSGKVGDRVGIIGEGYGGLIALQALLRAEIFSVWVNFNTPMRPFNLGYWNLLAGESDRDRVHSLMGGAGAIHDYLSTIDPKPRLAAVKVPSFHFYFRRTDNTLDAHGEIAETFARESPAPSRFVRARAHRNVWTFLSEDYDHAGNAERIDLARELLPFLQAHLPPAETAPSAAN